MLFVDVSARQRHFAGSKRVGRRALCIAWISKHVRARVLRPFRQLASLSAQSAKSLRVGSEAESFHRAPWIGSRRAGSFDFPLCWASPFFNSGLAAGAGSHRWKARPLPSLSSTCCRVAIAKPRTSTRVYSWVFCPLRGLFSPFSRAEPQRPWATQQKSRSWQVDETRLRSAPP